MTEGNGQVYRTLSIAIGDSPFTFHFRDQWLLDLAAQRYGLFQVESSGYDVYVNIDAPDGLLGCDSVHLHIYEARMSVGPQLAIMQAVTRGFEFDSLFRMLLAVRLNGDGVLLHASTVIHQDGAYVFMGHSGAGKSTIVALSAPRRAFTDDLSLLRIHDTQVWAYSTPFWGKYRLETVNLRAPLAGVYDLVQSPENKKERLLARDAVRALSKNAFLFQRDRPGLQSFLGFAGRLAMQVPVFRLYFRREPSFWETISA